MPELKNLYVFIHTLEIRVNKNKRIFENMYKPNYVKSIRGDDMEAIIKINPNRYYDWKLKSLTAFNHVFELILSELGIDEYYISRLDIALDSHTEFDETYKINSFIIDLDSTRLNNDNTFMTTHKSGAKRQYMLKKSKYHHTFYDKKAESKGRDDACSRTEIRYIKDIDGNDITAESAINKTIYNLSHFIKEFDITINEFTDDLYNLYISETSDNSVATFTDFVTRNSHMIKTQKIFASLYKRCMTGSCASWLNKYRKNRSIELPSKSDIKSRLNEYKKALIYYKNN